MAALPIENFDKSLEVVNHVFASKGLPRFLFRHKTLQQCLNQVPHLQKRMFNYLGVLSSRTDDKG